MKGEIYYRLSQGNTLFAFYSLQQGFTLSLKIKVNQRGNPAAGSGNCAGFKVILGIGSHKGHSQMCMGIYCSGKYVFAGSLYYLISFNLQVSADLLDLVTHHIDIGSVTAGGGDYQTTFD
ncbi:hypothetical protein ES708_08037 [subsurface metagenome]